MVSIRFLISKFSSPCTIPLVTEPRAPITIGITVTGGTHGVMVIVVGNGHGVQILDENDCISHSTNTLGKGMNPIILPPAMGK